MTSHALTQNNLAYAHRDKCRRQAKLDIIVRDPFYYIYTTVRQQFNRPWPIPEVTVTCNITAWDFKLPILRRCYRTRVYSSLIQHDLFILFVTSSYLSKELRSWASPSIKQSHWSDTHSPAMHRASYVSLMHSALYPWKLLNTKMKHRVL